MKLVSSDWFEYRTTDGGLLLAERLSSRVLLRSLSHYGVRENIGMSSTVQGVPFDKMKNNKV